MIAEPKKHSLKLVKETKEIINNTSLGLGNLTPLERIYKILNSNK